jgi:hypothetical protein
LTRSTWPGANSPIQSAHGHGAMANHRLKNSIPMVADTSSTVCHLS